jgi:hypothetical protein
VVFYPGHEEVKQPRAWICAALPEFGAEGADVWFYVGGWDGAVGFEEGADLLGGEGGRS